MTGSANILARSKVAESLAGRMIIETLWPLSPQEIRGHKFLWIKDIFEKNILDVFSRVYVITYEDVYLFILKGGYPNIWSLTSPQQDQWFQSYIQTLIERDLRDFTNYSDVLRMYTLFQHLILRSGGILNTLDLSR